MNIKTILTIFLLILIVSCSQKKDANKVVETNISTDDVEVLTVGDTIPAILGYNEDSILIKSSDFKGEKLVIYFYPKDETLGCTSQACNLRDNYEILLMDGYKIIGVSADNVESHKKFVANHSLPFSLIADTDKKLIKKFGAYTINLGEGIAEEKPSRVTFIIDENGVIKEIISSEQVDVSNHTIQILDLGK